MQYIKELDEATASLCLSVTTPMCMYVYACMRVCLCVCVCMSMRVCVCACACVYVRHSACACVPSTRHRIQFVGTCALIGLRNFSYFPSRRPHAKKLTEYFVHKSNVGISCNHFDS